MRPSPTSALLPSPPLRRSVDQEDSGGRVSRLCTRDANDDDLTLQSVISQSSERSMLEVNAPELRSDDVTMVYLPRSQEDMAEAERGRRPSPQDKEAEFRSELASSREGDEDVFDSQP